MLVPSSLTPARLPKGDGWLPPVGTVGESGERMGFEGTRDMVVGDAESVAPGMATPLWPCSRPSAATRSASDGALVRFVGGTELSAIVTETVGVMPVWDDMSAVLR